MVTLSGVDARGYRLWNLNDTNLVSPFLTETYTIQDATGANTGSYSTPIYSARSDTAHAHSYGVNNEGSTWYRAGSLEVRERAWHGLDLRASYTFSDTITDIGGPNAMFVPVPLSTTDNNPGADKATAPTDQRHRFIGSFVWAPEVTTGSTALRTLANGWQISAIGELASGLPETPTLLLSGQQFSGGVLVYPSTLNGGGGWNRVPFQAIASLKTGRVENLNMRFARSFTLTDVLRGTAMIEAYNMLNSQYITGVNTISYVATTGVLRPVAGAGAGNAAQGFPYGTNARSVQVAFRLTF